MLTGKGRDLRLVICDLVRVRARRINLVEEGVLVPLGGGVWWEAGARVRRQGRRGSLELDRRIGHVEGLLVEGADAGLRTLQPAQHLHPL